MSLCPYCETELDLKLSLLNVEIDKDFKNGVIQAYERFYEALATSKPLGGMLSKITGEIGYHILKKYYEKIGALPIVNLSCKNCNKTINIELLKFDLSGTSS
ncbi:MAG: hypothetical protein ACFFHV_13530 [Promethearchaeota archaeon]